MDESIWAKLETKFRKLVFELLEPTINRVAEHKETLENLRRTDESLLRKIDTLDTLTDKITKKLAVIDDFTRKIHQFDATIQVHETTFAQDREAIRDELSTFLNQLTNAEGNISNLIGQSQALRTDLINLAFDTNNSKNSLSNRVEEIREEALEKLSQLEYKHTGLDNYAVALDKKFNFFLRDFEVIDVIAKKADHNIEDMSNQLKIIFKNFSSHKKESKDLIEKIRHMSMQFSQTATDQMRELKDRFNIEVPIQTQLIISENLHSVLELKEKKLLAELEKEKFAEWEVMLTNSPFESKIKLARQRTQEVIDVPMPKSERLIPLQMPVSIPEIKEKVLSPQEKNIKRRESKLNEQVFRPPADSKKKGKKTEKIEFEVDDLTDKVIKEEDPESVEKTSEDLVKKIEIKQEIENSETKEPKESLLKTESNKSEVLNQELESDIEELKNELSQNSEENEENQTNFKVKPFDVNLIKQHAEKILEILGINSLSEEISLINDEIKRIHDEIASQVKKLLHSDSSLDEKVQALIKKQFETIQKIEELKTLQQNHSARCEADKKTAEESDGKILEKLMTQDLEINNKFTDLSKKFTLLEREAQSKLLYLTESSEKLTRTTEKSLDKQEKTLQIFYDDISKTNQVLNLQIQQAALECNSAVTQRKRDFHDNQSEFRKIQSIIDGFSKKSDQVNRNIDNFSRTVSLLIEFAKVVHALMQQDEFDRESIALFGVKDSKVTLKGKSPVTIDKQCISCSGQPNFITNAFKLACLAYSPTSILFKETIYERLEMIEILKRIVEGVSDETATDFVGLLEGQKYAVSTKAGQFRPYSRLSNLSFTQSLVSATPDLPPLSFPKRLG